MIAIILGIILSLGTIYAFIPIIVIIILILAARGSARGEDFFSIFGITTLINLAGGIGGGGAGKGISRSAQYHADSSGKARGAFKDNVRKTITKKSLREKLIANGQVARYTALYNGATTLAEKAKYGGLKAAWEKKARDAGSEIATLQATTFATRDAYNETKMTMLKRFSREHLDGIARVNRMEDKIKGLSDADALAALASALSLYQIREYTAEFVGKPGNAPVPRAPTGKVKMSVGDFYRSYTRGHNPFSGDRNFKTSKGLEDSLVNRQRDILAVLSADELKEMLKQYKLKDVPATDDKDELALFAEKNLSPFQVNNYVKSKHAKGEELSASTPKEKKNNS
jgi:hypothetical protein